MASIGLWIMAGIFFIILFILLISPASFGIVLRGLGFEKKVKVKKHYKEGVSSEPDEKLVTSKYDLSNISTGLKAVIWIVIILSVISSLGIGIIGAVICLACAKKCASWAFEINRSENWAYAIGFFFGIFGLIAYLIYYHIRSN